MASICRMALEGPVNMPAKRKTSARSAPRAKKSTGKMVAPKIDALELADPTLKPLNLREKLFIEEFLSNHLSTAEAAFVAYNPGNRRNATIIGHDVLNRPHVRAVVNARLEQARLSAEETLALMSFHARGSIEDFINLDTGEIDVKKAKQAQSLGLIKKYRTRRSVNPKDQSETFETEIEMYDAQTALRDLGRFHRLFAEDTKGHTEQHLHLYVNGKPLSEQRQLTAGDAQIVDAEVVDGE